MTGPSSAAARFARFRRFFVKNAPTGAPPAAVGMAAWRRLPGLLAVALFAVFWGAAAQAQVLSIVDTIVAEGNSGTTTMTFTVNLFPSSTQLVTVDWATSTEMGDAATSNTDFTGVNGTLTFQIGDTSGTISVQVIGDTVDEVDETFTVTLSNASNATISDATAKGTITDDDQRGVELSESSVTVTEASVSRTATYTVVLTSQPTADVTITPESGDTGAATVSRALTFSTSNWATPQTVTVAGQDDDVDSGDERRTTVRHAVTGGDYGSVMAASVTVTVTDDDTRGVELSELPPAGLRVHEAGGTASYTVVLKSQPTADVTITPESGDTGAATVSGALTFRTSNWATPQTVTVTGQNDDVHSTARSATVSHTVRGGDYGSVMAASVTVTVADDDDRTLTVSDAAVDEGGAAQFTVTLSGAVAAEVTVDWETVDGTAKESDDYEQQSGTLTFTQSNTEFEQTVTVPTVRDAAAEGNETFTVRLSNAAFSVGGQPVVGLSVSLADAVGTGTILDDVEEAATARSDRVNEEVLPRIAQTMAASTVSAVTGRIEAVTSGAPMTNIADRSFIYRLLKANEGSINEGSFDLKGLMDGRTFALPLHAGEDGMGGLGGLAFWGSGDYTSLEGRPDSLVEWEGDMFTAQLGMDTRLNEKVLAGLSVSRSRGSFDFTDRTSEAQGGVAVAGTYDSRMTGIHPYVNLSLSEDLGVWAKLGYGRGEVEIDDDQPNDPQSSDTEMMTVALGANGRLFSDDSLIPGGEAALKLKGEGAVSRIVLEGNDRQINPLTSNIQRLRMLLEGSYAREMASGAVLTPALEIGVRHDDGDGVTGTGFELGGSLRVFEPSAGVTVEGRGRILLAHEDEYEEWGVGGLVRIDPGAGGRGLSLSLAPVYGDTASGTGRLWDGGATGADAETANDSAPQMRLDSELGYGFDALGGRGVLTPYGGVSLAGEGAQSYRVGGRFGLGSALDLSLEGERREPAGTAAAEHGVMLRMNARW